MKLRVSLRTPEGEHQDATDFVLPVKRIWWEGVSRDMHIQFTGFSDTNILPADNAYEDEMIIPEGARLFRDWLESRGIELNKETTMCCCILESGKAKGPNCPSKRLLKDLIDQWESPNR